jgi:23S rRNA pseudouridine1911/1915/1917 synthase
MGLFREVDVGPGMAGMRLDRWLAGRFPDRSRSSFARALREGLVRDTQERKLDAAFRVLPGMVVRVYVPGIAPSGGPPPFPEILYEDDRVVAIDKPAGLLAHPAGSNFAWGVISLAKARWPGERMDLVHRLDRDTSGVMLLTKDVGANRFLKAAIEDGALVKEYEALCRGVVPWDTRSCTGAIGFDGGEVRVKMRVRDDGLPARTDVTVLARGPSLTHVHCRLFTGRTHQIRVHLDEAGFSLLGDRLYGVPPRVFLGQWDPEQLPEVVREAGAPRHALHARRSTFPHPDGGTRVVEAPLAPDLVAWWNDPAALAASLTDARPDDPE